MMIQASRIGFLRKYVNNITMTPKSKLYHPSIGKNQRYYHSYPDPNEKPILSQYRASTPKTIDKSDKSFVVDNKFRLDKAFPGIPITKGVELNSYPKTYMTKLSNGVTVASQDLPSLMSSFAVIVGSGSSDENQTDGSPDSTFGASHAIETTSFRGTTTRTHDEVKRGIEKLGGVAQCISTKESILYCIDVLRENSEVALDILADCIINPVYSEEDIEESKKIMMFQQDELPTEVLSRDAINLAAFKGSPLGNHHFCPSHKVNEITADLIRKFRSKYFIGENIVIAGAGVEHELFVKWVESKFSNLPSIGSLAYKKLKDERKPSIYTGGILLNERQLKEPFIKIALGFEIGGWSDQNFVPACVLQQLLGGGSSFSAGGPGKGMYTRLYTQVLNQHHWAESVEAFVSIYNESGIFSIDGACMPEYSANLISVIVDQLTLLSVKFVSDEELIRAKNMLRSMMMMQLESRLVICEDIARQVSTYGFRELPNDVSARIEKVTKEDLYRVAKLMVAKPPVLGCVGHDLKYIPPYSRIEEFVRELTTAKANP